MRVLLVQTPSIETVSSEKVYPLGIVRLAGAARKESHEVSVFDMNLSVDPFGGLKNRLSEFEPDVVGLSLRNIDPLGNKSTSLVIPFVAAARLVSRLAPKAVILAGGTGFSLFPERIMREVPEIRFAIVGEAEVSFPRLLASLDNPPAVGGLCYRDRQRVIVIPPGEGLDMSEYARCETDLLDPSLYRGVNAYVPAVGIEGKRGCPYGCAYCVYPVLQGRVPRCRQPASIVDEMEFLHNQHGIGSFHFTDPVLNAPEGHLEGICEELLRRRLAVRWDGFMREDSLTGEKVSLYERAGCECFSFSPDGLCDEALEVLGKGITEADILKAARLVSQTDVTCVYHFLVNVPGETEGTAARAEEMIEKLYALHARKRNLGTIVLNNIRILPGTAIEAHARAKRLLRPDADLLYPTYYNPPPFETLRYRLETLHVSKNVLMWRGVE
jgi:anaerobic magnesium-protoporphyrin IX monomethyl ester cyclase